MESIFLSVYWKREIEKKLIFFVHIIKIFKVFKISFRSFVENRSLFEHSYIEEVGVAETRDHRCFYHRFYLVFVLTTMLRNIKPRLRYTRFFFLRESDLIIVTFTFLIST